MSDQKRKAVRKHRRFTSEKDGAPSIGSLMKCALCALPITVAVGLLLLFVATAVLMATKDPDRYHTAAGLALVYLTAFCGGVIVTRLYGRRSPLLCALCESVLLILLMALIALFLPNEWKNGLSGGMAVLTRVLLLPTCILGAFWAARKKTVKRKRHR